MNKRPTSKPAKAAFVTLSLLATLCTPQAKAASDNTILVCTKPKANVQETKLKLANIGCTILRETPCLSGKFTVLQVKPNSADLQATLKRINAIGGISCAEKNFPSVAQQASLCTPNDPEFSSQYALQSIKWSEARCTLKLLGINQRVQPRFTALDSGCSKIQNGNEMIDVQQFNFAENANGIAEVPFDSGVHGTAVIGIAAASTNNSSYIAGVASHNLPVKVTSCRVQSGAIIQTLDAIDAMIWCVDNQAQRGGPGVINMSINSFGLPKYNGSAVLQEIARSARKQGDLFVNASANEGIVHPSPERSIRRVLALDENNLLASFSNTGPFKASAPGVLITTFDSPHSIAFGIGTSYACPTWSGCISFLQSINPNLNAVEADAIVYRTSATTTQGYRLPDLNKAVLHSVLFPWL